MTTRWPVVLTAVAAGIVVAFQVGKVPAALPTLRDELGFGLVAAGWVISMFNVIGSSAAVVVGAFADWLGPRRVAVWGLLAAVLGSVLGAAATDVAVLLVARFVEGFGAILVIVSAPTLILRAARPRDLRLALSVWGTYMPAGMASMILVTPPLIEIIGWRGLWLANAALLAALAALLWMAYARVPMPAAQAIQGARARLASLGRDIRRTATARGPLLLAGVFATYAGNYAAVMSFLPTFLIEDRQYGSGSAAALTAFAIATNVFGNLTGGWLMHHGARRWLLIFAASAIMGATSIGIYSEAVPDMLRYLLCVAFSYCGGLLPASVLSGGPVHAPTPELVSTTNGVIVQGTNIGQLVCPPALAALVHAAGGWHASPWLVASLAAVGCAFAIAIGTLEAKRGLSRPTPG